MPIAPVESIRMLSPDIAEDDQADQNSIGLVNHTFQLLHIRFHAAKNIFSSENMVNDALFALMKHKRQPPSHIFAGEMWREDLSNENWNPSPVRKKGWQV